MHRRLFLLASYSSLVVLGAAAACGDSDGTVGPGAADAGGLETSVDARTAPPDGDVPDTSAKVDAGAPDTGADATTDGASDGGADAKADATGDGGADAADAALTNHALWLASSGLTPQGACVPWTLVDTATPEDPVLAAGKLTVATSDPTENIYYEQTGAALITPAQLEIEARVRHISGGVSAAAARAPTLVAFVYGATKRKNILFIGPGQVFLLSAESTMGMSASVTTDDAAHDYRIVVNTSTHAVEVFRDTVSILTGTAFLDTAVGSEALISFGEGSIITSGSSAWERVWHNAHAPGPCP